MIHVATVHYKDDQWIEPQLRFLRRNLPAEHRVYAVLNDIDPRWESEFAYTSDVEGNHTSKLNTLAEVIRADADPEDLILFVDGDAFPIAPIGPELLGDTPLAAVRRSENLGDQQPHPCFALTTVGFWFDIGGDWRKGYRWTSSVGVSVTDVGGNLLGILTEREIPWRPLLRSNQVDLDPLWFGLYADVAYHHGAGFRNKVARHVKVAGEAEVRAAAKVTKTPSWIPLAPRAERWTRAKVAKRRHLRRLEEYRIEGERLSAEVFESIRTDDEFYRRFMEPQRAPVVIVSFEHNFVFLKVPKTAGTSVELFLDPLAGEDAIVTRITPPEEGNRPRNSATTAPVVTKALWNARRDRDALGRIVRTVHRKDSLFFNHMAASLVRERIGPRTWDRMYRFCFDRNPWDKSISRYFWRTRRLDPRPPFDEWAVVKGNLPNAHRIYTIDDELAVDVVGRYEHLADELATVLAKLGIDSPVDLPHAKGTVRPARDDTPVGERADAVIRDTFAWEIRHFGWERPPGIPWS